MTNEGSNNVSVIDTTTENVTATVNANGFNYPYGVAVKPDRTKVYVANSAYPGTVSVIDTATENITTSVPVERQPYGVAVTPDGTKAYVTNEGSNNISVIDTATENVTAKVSIGNEPYGVAVTPDGTKVYVTNEGSNTISIIDTATDTVTATVNANGFNYPYGVAVSPDGTKVYVANSNDNAISVIDTVTDNVTAAIPVGYNPYGVAVTPNGTKVYVTNEGSNNVSVIYTATNNVITTVPVGLNPQGIAATPEGTKVYVANSNDNTVSVIDIATDSVTATVPVGSNPTAFGQFIGPIPLTYKITPTITWSNPADIVYGTPLSNVQLDANASVPGTFVYTPQSGTVLSAGKQTLIASFTPSDSTNYTSGRIITNSITVNQAIPTITWSNPANIAYGTALGNTQLDATGSVPGSFSYNPVAGTVLGVGTQTLNATLTPTDTVNYTTATRCIQINVTPAAPIITWNKPANITYGTALRHHSARCKCFSAWKLFL